jgi:hypothetical protein
MCFLPLQLQITYSQQPKGYSICLIKKALTAFFYCVKIA